MKFHIIFLFLFVFLSFSQSSKRRNKKKKEEDEEEDLVIIDVSDLEGFFEDLGVDKEESFEINFEELDKFLRGLNGEVEVEVEKDLDELIDSSRRQGEDGEDLDIDISELKNLFKGLGEEVDIEIIDSLDGMSDDIKESIQNLFAEHLEDGENVGVKVIPLDELLLDGIHDDDHDDDENNVSLNADAIGREEKEGVIHSKLRSEGELESFSNRFSPLTLSDEEQFDELIGFVSREVKTTSQEMRDEYLSYIVFMSLKDDILTFEEAVDQLEEWMFVNSSLSSAYILGKLFMFNEFGHKNLTKAKSLFLFAAFKGYNRAQYEVGFLIENGILSYNEIIQFQHIFKEKQQQQQEEEKEKEEEEKKKLTQKKELNYQNLTFLIHEEIMNEEDFDAELVSNVYYFFSALNGYWKAQLTLGHMYFRGIWFENDCEAASHYYLKGIRYFEYTQDLYQLFEEQEEEQQQEQEEQQERMKKKKGMKTRAISLSNVLHNRFLFSSFEDLRKIADTMKEERELVEFLEFSAANGDPASQIALGYSYFFGLNNVEVDIPRAMGYFEDAIGPQEGHNEFIEQQRRNNNERFRVPRRGRGTGNEQRQEQQQQEQQFQIGPQLGQEQQIRLEGYSALALIYKEEFGDYETAIDYFEKGIQKNDTSSMNGLGKLYFQGEYVEQDYEKALHLFNRSAHLGSPEGQYFLGLMHFEGLGMKKKNYIMANRFFRLSSRSGYILADRYIGEIAIRGLAGKGSKNCHQGITFLRRYFQEMVWMNDGEVIVKELAMDPLNTEIQEDGLLWFLYNSQLGDVVSEMNAAFMLEKEMGSESFYEQQDDNKGIVLANRRCLELYYRASLEGNLESNLKLGDFYYYGVGGVDSDYMESVKYYRKGCTRRVAQSCFNLGYMHEKGEGVELDFHLAKRYYEQALEFDPKYAYLAVYLALSRLFIKWGVNIFLSFFGWTEKNHNANFAVMIQNHEFLMLILLVVILFFLVFVRNVLMNENFEEDDEDEDEENDEGRREEEQQQQQQQPNNEESFKTPTKQKSRKRVLEEEIVIIEEEEEEGEEEGEEETSESEEDDEDQKNK